MKYALIYFALIYNLIPFSPLLGQTRLSPGDILPLTVNTDDPKNFDFLCLRDIDKGTRIIFTDKAWDGSKFTTREGQIVYSADKPVAAGTVLHYSGFEENGFVRTGNYNPSSSGDNILVYQGSDPAPDFLFGIGVAKGKIWLEDGQPTSVTSVIPAALSIEAGTILELGPGDNYQYDEMICTDGSVAAIRNAITDPHNWLRNDTLAFGAFMADIRLINACKIPE